MWNVFFKVTFHLMIIEFLILSSIHVERKIIIFKCSISILFWFLLIRNWHTGWTTLAFWRYIWSLHFFFLTFSPIHYHFLLFFLFLSTKFIIIYISEIILMQLLVISFFLKWNRVKILDYFLNSFLLLIIFFLFQRTSNFSVLRNRLKVPCPFIWNILLLFIYFTLRLIFHIFSLLFSMIIIKITFFLL